MNDILVVDDMALCREPIAESLRRRGHAVRCASRGSEALRVAQEERPLLILLDVNMPGMDGLTTLKLLRRNPNTRDIPVVLLTDRADRDSIIEAKQHGIQGYLLKSTFSLDALYERVDACLRKSAPESSALPSAAQVIAARDPRAAVLDRPRLETPDARQGTATCSRPAPSVCPVPAPRPPDPSELMLRVYEKLKLRPLGMTVQNVLATTSNAQCSVEDVARVVSNDQALGIQLLRVANSAIYNRGRPVSGIKDAVQRLGIQEVRQIVMALEVLEAHAVGSAERISLHAFWEHSLACGVIAAAVAKARRVHQTDDYFLWGGAA